MPSSIFLPKQKPIQRSEHLRDFTIRDFSGGWNVVDSELNLTSKFARISKNVQRGIDGSNEIRPGTRLFAETNEFLDEIVNKAYYNGAIIAVGANGKIVKITADAKVFLIWDDAWAHNLPGSPAGWSETSFVSLVAFNGFLNVHNGVNKPLRIRTDHKVEYLNDPATGSNAFTPIGRFALAAGRYMVIAGLADSPDRICISAIDTDGVYVNDAAPNDAVNVNLGSRVVSGSQAIKGMSRFRDKIVVAFEECLLPGTLGQYNSEVHVPAFDDAVANNGSISHRVILPVNNGEDLLFVDPVGVNSIKRALFTGSIQPERLSRLIDPEIQASIRNLHLTVTTEDKTFAILDPLSSNYMMFIPNGDAAHGDSVTETRCFVFKKIDELKIESWHEWRGWNFSCGCVSSLKRVFFSKGSQVYILGGIGDEINADFVGDQESFDDGTFCSDNTGMSPVADINDSGVPIQWVWELPWTDNQHRYNTKESRYIGFDTEGDESFDVSMFVDNRYVDVNDPGEPFLDGTFFDDGLGMDVEVLLPALKMTFRGGTSPGYGRDQYGQIYGGGRPTRTEGLYAWRAKFKLSKLRFEGEAMSPLKFVAARMGYMLGSIRGG